MKPIFKATAILSGSSIVTILVSLVSAKVMAVFLQPGGYGYYGLLQSFVGIASVVTGMGMATGLVRMGAAAAAGNDALTIASLRRASWWLFAGLGALASAVLLLFRVPLSRWAAGREEAAGAILLMSIALLFTVAGNIQTGTLNAHHRVEALAKSSIVTTVLAAAFAIVMFVIWRERGVVAAIIGGAVVGWLGSAYFLHRAVGPVMVKPSRRQTLQAAWSLLRFGGPYTASTLVGTGAQLVLPMIVLHMLDQESVGYYKAAAAISVGYLSFLVTAMGQDYYPRISAVRAQPAALVKLINEQHRLVMLISVPMILGTLALAPYVIPLVYSSKFLPAAAILEYQLIGDLFKFSSWTMSFAILARCRSSVFFLTESVGGVTMLAVTWAAVRWFGLPGLGIAFLATYIVYYLVVWVITRREIALVWTSSNVKMMLAAVAAAVVVRVLPFTRFSDWRTPVALTLALVAGGFSASVLWREYVQHKRGYAEPASEVVAVS